MDAATEVILRIAGSRAPAEGPELWLGLQPHPGVLGVEELDIVDRWAARRDGWVTMGRGCDTDEEGIAMAHYRRVLLRPERQAAARQAQLARALLATRPGGSLWVALPVREGGKRLAKELADLGAQVVDAHAKARCRVVHARRPEGVSLDEARRAVAEDGATRALDGLWTRPGLFSWDEVDPGTRLLAAALPDKLGARVADAGCGPGWLSVQILGVEGRCEHLDMLEADARALGVASRNVEEFGERTTLHHVDAAAPWPVRHLDAVVTNPPFHRGGDHDVGLTEAILAQAARATLPGGRVYAVGKHNVPIGRFLRGCYVRVEEVRSGEGYRVWRGIRPSQ